jgi:hypothetical protein
VRFVDVSDETVERIWGLIGVLAIDFLAHEANDDFEFKIVAN